MITLLTTDQLAERERVYAALPESVRAEVEAEPDEFVRSILKCLVMPLDSRGTLLA